MIKAPRCRRTRTGTLSGTSVTTRPVVGSAATSEAMLCAPLGTDTRVAADVDGGSIVDAVQALEDRVPGRHDQRAVEEPQRPRARGDKEFVRCRC